MNEEGESPPTASYGLALSDAATASTLLPGPASAPAVTAPAATRLPAAAHPAPSRLSAAPAMLAVPGLSQALMPIIESPDRQGLPNVLPWDLPQALDVQGRTKAGDNSGEPCVRAVTCHPEAWPQPPSALTARPQGPACLSPATCSCCMLLQVPYAKPCQPARRQSGLRAVCEGSMQQLQRGYLMPLEALTVGLLVAATPLAREQHSADCKGTEHPEPYSEENLCTCRAESLQEQQRWEAVPQQQCRGPEHRPCGDCCGTCSPCQKAQVGQSAVRHLVPAPAGIAGCRWVSLRAGSSTCRHRQAADGCLLGHGRQAALCIWQAARRCRLRCSPAGERCCSAHTNLCLDGHRRPRMCCKIAERLRSASVVAGLVMCWLYTPETGQQPHQDQSNSQLLDAGLASLIVRAQLASSCCV